MHLSAALPIIRALADGVNPITGELYPDHSPYSEPRTLRALYAAVDCMDKQLTIERDKEILATLSVSQDDWDVTPESVKTIVRAHAR